MVLMVVLLSDVDIQFFVCNFLNKHVPVSKSSFAFAGLRKLRPRRISFANFS